MFRIYFVLFPILTAACSLLPGPPRDSFTADNYRFEPGETIALTYDAADSTAKFTKGEPIFLSVRVNTDGFIRWYRKPMTKQGPKYSASFRIPNNATSIAFFAAPKGNSDIPHSIGGTVIRSDMVLRTSVYAKIANAPGMWIAWEEYTEDSKTNPESMDRYAAMWYAQNRGVRDPSPYYPVVDSLYRLTVEPMLAPDAGFQIDTYNAALICLAADLQRGNFARAARISAACNRLHSRGLIQGPFMQLLRDLYGEFARSAQMAETESDRRFRAQVLSDIVGIGVHTESPQILLPLMDFGLPHAYFDGSDFLEIYTEVRKKENIETIARIIATRDFDELLNEVPWLYEIQCGLAKSSGVEAGLEFSKRLLPVVDSSLIWMRTDTNLPVAGKPPVEIAAAFHAMLDSLRNIKVAS